MDNIQLDQKDVQELFEEPKKTSKSTGVKILQYTGISLLVLIFGFGLVNGAALYSQAKYIAYNNILKTQFPSQASNFTISADIASETDNHIIIPKIGVYAPVTWNVDQANLQTVLKTSTAQLSDSSLPTDETGNVVIFGNSSYYLWPGNNMASVFTLLTKLQPGDPVVLDYENNIFSYQVTNSYVVKSGDVEIQKPNDNRILTLVTYTPLGTTLYKYVVVANFVSQTPLNVSAATPTSTASPSTEPTATATSTPTSTNTPTASASPTSTALHFLPQP